MMAENENKKFEENQEPQPENPPAELVANSELITGSEPAPASESEQAPANFDAGESQPSVEKASMAPEQSPVSVGEAEEPATAEPASAIEPSVNPEINVPIPPERPPAEPEEPSIVDVESSRPEAGAFETEKITAEKLMADFKAFQDNEEFTPEQKQEIYKSVLTGNLKEMVDAAKTGVIDPERKDTINIAYFNAALAFRELTGEDLKQKIKSECRAEAENLGLKVMSKKEYFGSENTALMEKKYQKSLWDTGAKKGWENLTDKERGKYADLKTFASQIEQKRLDLEKQGIHLSRDVFCTLLGKGYKPQDISKKWYSKKLIISHSGVSMGIEKGTGAPVEYAKSIELNSIEDLNNWALQYQKKFNGTVKKLAADRMEKKYQEGHASWMRRKIRKTDQIITKAVEVPISSPEEQVAKDEKTDWFIEDQAVEAKFRSNWDIISGVAEKLAKSFGVPEDQKLKLKTWEELSDDQKYDEKTRGFFKKFSEECRKVVASRKVAIDELSKRRIAVEQKRRNKILAECGEQLELIKAA